MLLHTSCTWEKNAHRYKHNEYPVIIIVCWVVNNNSSKEWQGKIAATVAIATETSFSLASFENYKKQGIVELAKQSNDHGTTVKSDAIDIWAHAIDCPIF